MPEVSRVFEAGDVPTRNLVLVLGDQLDHRSAAFDGFDQTRDAVWMAEVAEETEHVWCSKIRIAAFLSAMRHFAAELKTKGRRVHYTTLPTQRAQDRGATFGEVLEQDVRALRPERLVVVQPGDYRVHGALVATAEGLGVALEVREDRHFYCSLDELHAWAESHPGMLLETFYEHLRKKHHILVDDHGEPEGGRWSFDALNRERFSRDKAGPVPRPLSFAPDRTTRAVLGMIEERFADHPATTSEFDLPVCRRHARALLRDFLDHRLASFGPYEDAMSADEPFLFHSRLSLPLNLELLDPRECVAGALDQYRRKRIELRSVEGFIRQILGWRELIRGVYWHFMPGYRDKNALGCSERAVPSFYWNGQTDMRCVRHTMQTVLSSGYAHHIQRLMVLGNFAMLAGVHPREFHEWHMAMYVDAVDWVSLPNALGMSQYGDGGIVGTKPYAASAQYINRMSNYCRACRYDPKKAVGNDACPFNALYWDFLARHRDALRDNARMNLQLYNLDKKQPAELDTIRARARELRERIDRGESI